MEKVENPVKRYFLANPDDKPYLLAKRIGAGVMTVYNLLNGTNYILPKTMERLVAGTRGKRGAITKGALEKWVKSRMEWQI